MDRGPWACDEDGCPAPTLSCAALASHGACASTFADVWDKTPPLGTDGMAIAQLCPRACGKCGADARADGSRARQSVHAESRPASSAARRAAGGDRAGAAPPGSGRDDAAVPPGEGGGGQSGEDAAVTSTSTVWHAAKCVDDGPWLCLEPDCPSVSLDCNALDQLSLCTQRFCTAAATSNPSLSRAL